MTVEVRTDEPERRFSEGATLLTDRAAVGEVTVVSHRWHSGRLLLRLRGVDDRNTAESLRGVLLSTLIDPDELPDDPDEFYDHQLVGLSVMDRSGARLGEVVQVEHGAQDLLVVRLTTGREAMIPFVRELIPEVDLDRGRLVVELPDGLLELGTSPT